MGGSCAAGAIYGMLWLCTMLLALCVVQQNEGWGGLRMQRGKGNCGWGLGTIWGTVALPHSVDTSWNSVAVGTFHSIMVLCSTTGLGQLRLRGVAAALHGGSGASCSPRVSMYQGDPEPQHICSLASLCLHTSHIPYPLSQASQKLRHGLPLPGLPHSLAVPPCSLWTPSASHLTTHTSGVMTAARIAGIAAVKWCIRVTLCFTTP